MNTAIFDWCLCLLLPLAPCVIPVCSAASDEGAVDKPQTFKLKEVSAFELGQGFIQGQRGTCENTPSQEVKLYPKFTSSKPLYGSVSFAVRRDNTDSPMVLHYALDESKGTGKGYDRLYLDGNRDLNLENDAALQPHARPPQAGLNYSNLRQQVLFEYVKIEFDGGAQGKRMVEILPRFTLSVYNDKEYPGVSFVRTRAFAGEVKFGGETYGVRLGNDYVITGSFDAPSTAVNFEKSGNEAFGWWGGNRLGSIHKVQGKFYTLGVTPSGDRLTISPYRGELGTLEVGAGNRSVSPLSISGSLDSREGSVPVGGDMEDGRPTPSRTCTLPAGDYSANYLHVNYGKLRVDISFNYHGDGTPRKRDRERVYAISVCKDKRFIFDFSNKPEVMFASPPRNHRIVPGDTLNVSAVLTDPKLDFMIRGLVDTTRKQQKDAKGNALGYEMPFSLDPTVLITRANGEKVAEGVMPFG